MSANGLLTTICCCGILVGFLYGGRTPAESLSTWVLWGLGTFGFANAFRQFFLVPSADEFSNRRQELRSSWLGTMHLGFGLLAIIAFLAAWGPAVMSAITISYGLCLLRSAVAQLRAGWHKGSLRQSLLEGGITCGWVAAGCIRILPVWAHGV